MRRIATRLLLAFTLALAALVPARAFAAQPENLEVTLASDKQDYRTGDTAELAVSIKNVLNTDVTDVSWNVELPSGMELASGEAASGKVAELAAGETFTTTVKASVVGEGGAAQGSGQATGTSGSMPATGDNTALVAGVAAVAGAALLALGLRARKRKHSGSLLLLALLAGTLAAASLPAQPAFADIASVGTSHTITIDGKQSEVKLSVSYGKADDGQGGDGGESYDYELRDDVTEVSDYIVNEDGSIAITGDESLSTGDKVAFLPTEENSLGGSGTLTSAVKQDDGTLLVTFEQATMPEEIFESISAHSSGRELDPSQAIVEEVDDSSTTEPSIQPLSWVDQDGEWQPDEGKLGSSKKVNLGGGSSVKAWFEIAPTLSYDIEWSPFNLKRCNLGIEGELEVGVEAHVQNQKAGKKINMYRAVFPLPLGLSIEVPVYARVKLEGDVGATVTYTLDTSIKRVKGKWVMKDRGSCESDLYAEAHLRMGAGVGVEFRCLGAPVVDAGVEAGADGTASVETHIDVKPPLTCSDVSAYAYLNASAGTETDWLVFLGWTYTAELIDEDNSPLSYKAHWENMKEVPECTYGKDEPTDPDPEEPTDPDVPSDFEDDGSVYPEYEDNGYGTEIKIDDQTGGNKLLEDFNVYGGTSLTVTSTEEETTLLYALDPGTVIRRTQWDYDLEEYVSETTIWPGELYQIHGGYAKIEVLCGRMRVYMIQSWGGSPSVTKGTCELIPYPLQISRFSMDMNVGDTERLYTRNNFDILDDYTWADKLQWLSSDRDVARVDSEGNVEAVGPGTAVITAYNPDWQSSHFERSCTVTVK